MYISQYFVIGTNQYIAALIMKTIMKGMKLHLFEFNTMTRRIVHKLNLLVHVVRTVLLHILGTHHMTPLSWTYDDIYLRY